MSEPEETLTASLGAVSPPVPHQFDDATEQCIYCAVPRYAVVDGIVTSACGAAPQAPAPPPSLNHGGPGVCRICYPNGAPTEQKQPTQQGELQL